MSFFTLDVLDEIFDLTESVSGGFSYLLLKKTQVKVYLIGKHQCKFELQISDVKQDPDIPDPEKSDPEPEFTASIDFGTSYCSWSFVKTVSSENSEPSSPEVILKKVPTVALIEPDGKTLKAFGHDAESFYKELAAKGHHTDYFYFLRFKMALDTEVNCCLLKII